MQKHSLDENIYVSLRMNRPLEGILAKVNNTETGIDKLVRDSFAERVKRVHDYGLGLKDETSKYMICIEKYFSNNTTKEELKRTIVQMFDEDVEHFRKELLERYGQGIVKKVIVYFHLPFVIGLAGITSLLLMPVYLTADWYDFLFVAIMSGTLPSLAVISRKIKKNMDKIESLIFTSYNLQETVKNTDMLELFERNKEYFKEGVKEYNAVVSSL